MQQGNIICKKEVRLLMLQKEIIQLVTTDMDGQLRKSPLDVGADEFSTTAVTARILNPADVGYKAGKNQ